MHNIIIDIIAVEKDTMPKISVEQMAKERTKLIVYKADVLGLKLGTQESFEITGPHIEPKTPGWTPSLPVKRKKDGIDGLLRINKVNMPILVAALSDNSDNWVGAEFTIMGTPVTNPSSKISQTGFVILPESVKKGVKKVGAK